MITLFSSILNYLMKRTILNLLPTFFLVLLPLFTLSQSTTVNFNYTGSSQNWVVPYCVSSITITGAGASGGGSNGGQQTFLSFLLHTLRVFLTYCISQSCHFKVTFYHIQFLYFTAFSLYTFRIFVKLV